MITKPNKYIVWDLETTGFNGDTDKVLEIGLMVIEGDEVKEKRSWILNHNIDIPEKITAINGMTREKCAAEGRDPKECLTEFMAYFDMKDKEAVPHLTHNGISFDIPFLMGNLSEFFGLPLEKRNETAQKLYASAIDTAVYVKGFKLQMEKTEHETFHEYARRVMGVRAYGVKYNLGGTCEEMDISTEGVELHRALADVHFTNEVFKRLLTTI